MYELLTGITKSLASQEAILNTLVKDVKDVSAECKEVKEELKSSQASRKRGPKTVDLKASKVSLDWDRKCQDNAGLFKTVRCPKTGALVEDKVAKTRFFDLLEEQFWRGQGSRNGRMPLDSRLTWAHQGKVFFFFFVTHLVFDFFPVFSFFFSFLFLCVSSSNLVCFICTRSRPAGPCRPKRDARLS